MNARKLFLVLLTGSLVPAVLFAAATPVAGKKKGSASDASTNAVPALTQVEIPQSVFVIPSQPREGRNPFFPGAATGPKPEVKSTKEPVLDTANLILNGLTSAPRKSAMINNRTFEPGEEGEVKLPNGTKVLIKCLQVNNESVVILIGGVRRELRLRSGI